MAFVFLQLPGDLSGIPVIAGARSDFATRIHGICASSKQLPSAAPSIAIPAGANAHAENLEAARWLAQFLADYGERGFGALTKDGMKRKDRPRIHEEVLHRLAAIGDHTLVPTTRRKKASHCGGVPPDGKLLKAFKDTPFVADPGNRIYSSIVRKLLATVNKERCTSTQQLRMYNIVRWNDAHLGDLIEAALAAADAAAAFEAGTVRSWAELQGGAHGQGDEVTQWLVKAVVWETYKSEAIRA